MFGLAKLVEPDKADLKSDQNYLGSFATYSEYNYLGSRLDKRVKKLHFRRCLHLALKTEQRQVAIDFGCSDGFFLPSLAKHFNDVIGIDRDSRFVSTAENLIKRRNLLNTKVFCNADSGHWASSELTIMGKADVLFALEVLEHVGTTDEFYPSKVAFIRNLFEMVHDDGKIIVSVPVMVGISFFIQRLAMRFLNLSTEKLSFPQLLRAVFLKNTDDLESNWKGGHLGFNHLKFERELKKHFKVKSHSVVFSKVYEIWC